ncbi:glycerol-3-phosphate acyltransferase [Thermoactinomyces mirandus]|uniref:Glycerol-3-phosphate acyltransferase n=1 Tax=Thermoactinomyces mirandus TaxID=2756294 RepID=A0A7W2ARW8_9BACL|nr:glycerol-3-phosphate acyltransferase [Thermoactinomyces mirandus]MBA4603038.1 glycerol-3-phosphate acyltransferase [Thermoactinomyces mirandus]
MKFLIIMVAAYLTGALPLHLWALGRSPSHFTLHRREIFLVIVVDLVKGMAVTLFGLALGGWPGACLAAILVVVGSMYSVFLGFRGGYGLSVAAGALLILSPMLILFGIIVYVISLLATRYLFISTLLTTIAMILLGLVLATHFYALVAILIVGGLIFLRTKPKWRRVRRKIEPPYRFKNPFRRIN